MGVLAVMKYLVGYAAVLVVMTAIDMLWLGVIAKPLYQQGIGHLMAEQPLIWAAVLFYLVYPIGITVFAVVPNAQDADWLKTAGMAALFGFFAYATYDLTNLATLKNWPISLAALDIAWGSLVSGVAAVAGRVAINRWLAS